MDLGTEFGFAVRDGMSHVEVIEGEIALKHRNGPEHVVETGGAWRLPEHGPEESIVGRARTFPEFSALAGAAGSTVGYDRGVQYRYRLAAVPRIVA